MRKISQRQLGRLSRRPFVLQQVLGAQISTRTAAVTAAEYDEIVKEIRLALQDCGRKLGIWVRKRKQAKNELERRVTFQRYIEEVADACYRLKGGRVDTERLRKQLQKMANRVTGGAETDRLLDRGKAPETDELESAIIRNVDGSIQGTVSALALEAVGAKLPQSE